MMLTVLAVTGMVAPVGVTAHRILGRVRTLAAERARIRALRGFVDAFSRELGVGTAPVTAAGHAVATAADAPEISGRSGAAGRELLSDLRTQILRVRLGAVPGADPGGPGDTGVARVLAVWESAQRHGTALGRLMGQIRVDLDARLAHLGHTSSALAGARLTETILLLLLPVGALGIGQSMGVSPVRFLFGNILGVMLLVFGVLLGCTGALWTESLTVTVLGEVGRRAGPSTLDAARILDIFAEALTAGLPVSVSWTSAVTCSGGDGTHDDDRDALIRRVAVLFDLGAGAEAWVPLRADPAFGPVARLAESGTRSGARLAEGVRAQADRLRQDAADQSLAGAERVLVVVAAPLTLCFLPAFVFVGLIPLVVGFAGL